MSSTSYDISCGILFYFEDEGTTSYKFGDFSWCRKEKKANRNLIHNLSSKSEEDLLSNLSLMTWSFSRILLKWSLTVYIPFYAFSGIKLNAPFNESLKKFPLSYLLLEEASFLASFYLVFTQEIVHFLPSMYHPFHWQRRLTRSRRNMRRGR